MTKNARLISKDNLSNVSIIEKVDNKWCKTLFVVKINKVSIEVACEISVQHSNDVLDQCGHFFPIFVLERITTPSYGILKTQNAHTVLSGYNYLTRFEHNSI